MDRQVTSLRQVAPTVAEKDFSNLPEMGLQMVEFAGAVMKQNAEAKIVENMSQAQLELNEITNKFQLDNESNPVMKTEDYDLQRKEIFDKYGEQIPSNYRYAWDQKSREMLQKNDLANQTWALKQAQVNTKNSLQKSMDNNFRQAYIDGQNFANSDGTIVDAMANFAVSKNTLSEFGTRNLGAESTSQLLKSYDEDSLKMFLGGMLQDNPSKALEFLNSDKVMGSMDPRDHSVLHRAAESRAKTFSRIAEDRAVTNKTMKATELFNKKDASIIDIESAAREHGFSEGTTEFLKRNAGYTEAPRKLSDSEKIDMKTNLQSTLAFMSKKEDITTKEINEFQDIVMAAKNADAITESQAFLMLNDIVTPLAQKKQESVEQYKPSWTAFSGGAGFEQLEEFYNTSVRQTQRVNTSTGAERFDTKIEYTNKLNKIKLNDYYIEALKEEAGKNNVGITEINTLPTSRSNAVYNNAFESAKRWYVNGINANLATLKDLPNQVLSNGKIIPVAAGTRELKPDFGVNFGFKTMKDNNGVQFRKYDNGNIEVLP